MYYLFTGEGLGWKYKNAFWKSSTSVDAYTYSHLVLLLESLNIMLLYASEFRLPYRIRCILGDLEEKKPTFKFLTLGFWDLL